MVGNNTRTLIDAQLSAQKKLVVSQGKKPTLLYIWGLVVGSLSLSLSLYIYIYIYIYICMCDGDRRLEMGGAPMSVV